MHNKKINFSNDVDTEFVNVLRDKVNTYFEETGKSKYGNLNMVLKTVFMLSLYLVPYVLMITGVVTNQFLILAMWAIMGFGSAGIGLSIMHDANHKSYSRHQWVNNLLAYTLNLLGGYSQNWKYQHNVMHHSFTNIDGFDEDINPASVLRFSPNKPLYNIHRFQYLYAWFFYGLMTVTWTIDKDFRQFFRYRKGKVVLDQNKSYNRLFAELLVSKILYYTYILVIPILVLPVSWWAILLFYFTMHFICGFILGIIFQTAHVMPSSKYPIPTEKGNIENNWVIHQLLTTTNYSPKSRVFSWFIGGLNYQVEHHLFPRVCHVHYRNISEIVKNITKEYSLPYNVQKNFFLALGKHAEMLKYLGSKVSV